MGIQKQEFYEGAALYQLVRCSGDIHIAYMAPFFVVGGCLWVYLKYSTGVRSPWGFTFNADEQSILQLRSAESSLVIGLICGADGIVALPYDRFAKVALQRDSAVRVSCFRRHREHFEVSGPDGALPGKIPPSDWQYLLRDRQQGKGNV